jgi:hypothetical protein
MRGVRVTHPFQEALRGVAVPVPFCLEQFCESVAGRLGRQLAVIGIPGTGPGWDGAWVSARDADLVYYPAAISGPRRDQVVVHHLCHMLLGHRARPAAGLAAVIAPDVGPQLVGLMLGDDEDRATGVPFADEAEQEQAAGTMSSVILAQAARGPRPAWPPDTRPVAALPCSGPPGDCCGTLPT